MPTKKKNKHRQCSGKFVVANEPRHTETRDIPHDMLCSVCLEVPRKAMLTDSCGHLLCETCVRKLFDSQGQSVPCPECRTPFDKHSIRHNLYIQRQLECLFISCPSAGCNWRQERSGMSNHLNVCPETAVTCPHGCGVSIKRKEIATHAATCEHAVISCEYAADGCDAKMMRKDATHHTGSECPYAQFACPNGCNAVISRKDIDEHEKTCWRQTLNQRA